MRIDAERDKREVRFFVFWAVYARAIVGSWHVYSLKEKITDNISKLSYIFLPDDVFFMVPSKRLPYRSY